jgi:hypothetical protein
VAVRWPDPGTQRRNRRHDVGQGDNPEQYDDERGGQKTRPCAARGGAFMSVGSCANRRFLALLDYPFAVVNAAALLFVSWNHCPRIRLSIIQYCHRLIVD